MRCRSHLQKYSELIISISGLSMFNEEALKLITKKNSLINDELLTCLFWGCGDFNWNLWSGLKVEVTEIISVSVYCLISCSNDWQRQYRIQNSEFRIQNSEFSFQNSEFRIHNSIQNSVHCSFEWWFHHELLHWFM